MLLIKQFFMMISKPICLLLFCFFGFTNSSFGQLVTIVEGATKTIPCDSACTTIHNVHYNKIKTDAYTISTIPYTTVPLSSPNILTLADDSFSTNIPIGFTFCYFNNTYNDVIVSRNGVVTFNPNYINMPCSFNTAQTLPYSSNTFPQEAIFCPFVDLGINATGQIKYKTIGVAPYRKFVLQFVNLPLFGPNCTTALNTFELNLYESTNYIDVQITNKSVCNANPLDTINFATLGIQGSNNIFLTAPNRNGSIWTAVNEGWRFSPSGPVDYNITWLPIAGATILQSNADSARICTNAYPYKAIVKYQQYCPSIIQYDTIVIDQIHPTIDSLTITDNNCIGDNNGTIQIFTSSTNLPLQYFVRGKPWSASNLFTGLPSDTFTIGFKDANNCSVFWLDTIYTKSKLKINIDSTKDADCGIPNGSIYLSAANGIPSYTWWWQNGSALPNMTNIYGDSNILVKVTDALGCIDSMHVKTEKKGPIAVLDSLIKSGCTDSTGKIYIHVKDSTGVPPFSFLWSNGDTTSFTTHCTGGVSYSVIITDAMGCSKTKSFLMEFDSLPNVVINVVKLPTCNKANGILNAIGNGGAPPYTYLWYNGATTQSISNADSGNVYVTITDAKGCTANFLSQITDILEMHVQSGQTNTKCNLSNGTAYVVPWNGVSPYSYQWSNGVVGNNSVNILAPGNYSVIVSDSLACIDTIYFNIAPSIAMNINTIAKNANCDTTNGIIYTTINNGVNPLQYAWSNGSNTANVYNLAAGIYTVLATDAIGCTVTSLVVINDDGKPYAAITNFQLPLCAGDSSGILTLVAFSGVGPYKYSLDGINFVSSPTLLNVAAGTYTLYVKDANSCMNDTVITLADAIPITIQYAPIDTLICFHDQSKFTVNTTGGYPPYKYNLDNATFNTNNQFANLTIGTHTLYLKDSIGCLRIFPIVVPGPDSALHTITSQQDVACFQTNTGFIHTQIAGGWPPYVWQWADGSDTLTRDSLVADVYTLQITDAKGCEVTQPYQVIQNQCCEAYLPSIFSPNADNINDKFTIIPRSTISEVQFIIYDRWGGKVFSTTNLQEGWDGNLIGKELPMDTYFYTLKYKCSFDENYFYLKGDVVLVR